MIHIISSALLSALLLVSGIPTVAVAAEQLRIGGSGSGLALVRQIGDAYMKQHPGVQVKMVSSLGSTGGIKAVGEGALDIAVSSRPPRPEEKGFEAVKIAITPLVFATAPGVDQKNITTTDLEQMYAGVKTTWPDGSRLRLILRPEKETDTKILRGISPAMDRAMTSALARHGMIMAVNDQDNLRMLERTPGAVGPITLAMVLAEQSSLNVLSYNGVKPGAKTVASGQYPLRRELYLVTRPSKNAAIQQFIAFVRSPAIRPLLDQAQSLYAE